LGGCFCRKTRKGKRFAIAAGGGSNHKSKEARGGGKTDGISADLTGGAKKRDANFGSKI